MPLPYSIDLVFNTNQSLHAPQRYDSEIATQNARIAAMLQYVLCACRFAHYLKLIMRENVGQVATVDSLRSMLNQWLAEYCIGNDDADNLIKARYPLRSANIDVRELAGKPGVYACVMHLQPHFQLDDVTASFQLLADLNNKADGRAAARGDQA
jgi:type VI secretion system protein ImpD